MNFYNEISHFDNIYNNKDKFSLEWAFGNAQDIIDNTYRKLCNYENTEDCPTIEESLDNQELLSERQRKVMNFVKDSKKKHRIFAYIYHVLSMVEIILSVLLVIFISNLSHHSTAMIESQTLSVCVVVIFALFKVFIERNLLRPKIEKWGWQAYRKSYTSLFEFLNGEEKPVNRNSETKEDLITIRF